jgi:hypothetical protein
VENTAMKTFMSLFELSKLADDDPSKPVVKQLLEWLIAPGELHQINEKQRPGSRRCSVKYQYF